MLDLLHPRLSKWFRGRFGKPTHAQEVTLPHVVAGRSVLLSSPTGSGKTLAGFLGVLDHLVRRLDEGPLPAETTAIYVSPLRALAYDMQKNLAEPLREMGLEKEIRIGLRNSDTSSSERAKLRKNAAAHPADHAGEPRHPPAAGRTSRGPGGVPLRHRG